MVFGLTETQQTLFLNGWCSFVLYKVVPTTSRSRNLALTAQVSVPSQRFDFLLEEYLLLWMGETLSMIIAFTVQRNRTTGVSMCKEIASR